MKDLPEQRRQALLVLGMHRSGTSAIALAFGQLGWELGRDPLDTRREVNRDGFGENRAVVDLNEAALSRFDRRWYHLSPLPAEWWKAPEAADLVQEAILVIEQQYAGSDRLLLKDPRLCLTLPLWLQALERLQVESRVLMAFRHPENVARSLARRDRIPVQLGYLLWLQYYHCAVRDSETVHRALVQYEDLLVNGSPALRVFDDIAIPDDFDCGIDPGLCHHASPGYSLPGEISELCDRMLSSLQASQPGSDGLPDVHELLATLSAETIGSLVDDCLEAMIGFSGMAVDVGEQHSLALATIRERDAQLGEKNAEIARLGCEMESLRAQFAYRILRKLRLLR